MRQAPEGVAGNNGPVQHSDTIGAYDWEDDCGRFGRVEHELGQDPAVRDVVRIRTKLASESLKLAGVQEFRNRLQHSD